MKRLPLVLSSLALVVSVANAAAPTFADSQINPVPILGQQNTIDPSFQQNVLQRIYNLENRVSCLSQNDQNIHFGLIPTYC